MKRSFQRLQRMWVVAMAAMLVLLCSVAGWAQSPQPSPRDMPELALQSEVIHTPPLPPAFATRDMGWIRFSYPPSVQGRIEPLAEAAMDARTALIAELGRPVLGNVEVRIARNWEEMVALAPSEASPPDYAEGVAYARLRLIVISLVAPNASQPPVLSEVLRHELAHIALHDAVGGHAVPRWFNEGFAVHASGESSLVRSRTLWTATLSKRLLPMSDLDRSFPANGDLAAIAYAESADFVRFLLRRQDRARFQMFVDRVERGEPFDSSLSDAYATSTRRLEFQWREELTHRYSWVPVFLGGGLLWVGVSVVLMVGWARRKRNARRTLARWAREEAEQDRLAAAQAAQEPVHVTITQRDARAPVSAGVLKSKETEVPKIEHNGRWYTVH